MHYRKLQYYDFSWYFRYNRNLYRIKDAPAGTVVAIKNLPESGGAVTVSGVECDAEKVSYWDVW